MRRESPPSTPDLPRALTRAAIGRGVRWLARVDPELAEVVDRLGEPPVWGRRPGFPTLIRIILEQQVSLAAARAMFLRVGADLGGVTPERVHAMNVSGLHRIGLTRQKARYCHGLAERVLDGTLDLAALARSDDEAGRRALRSVPGLGPWSVDVYYLMALRRPDVWPQGDLALVESLRAIKRLRSRPTMEEQRCHSDAWAPCRSIAARILWMHYLAARGRYTPRARER